MNTLYLGVATSIFPDRFEDPEHTLVWARQHRFDPVQIYLNRTVLNDPHARTRLAYAIDHTGRSLLFHLSDDDVADDRALRETLRITREHFCGSAGLFGAHGMVWHYRPGMTRTRVTRIVQFIRDNGFRSCPEPVLRGCETVHAVETVRRSRAVWDRGDSIPVLDIPRLFVIGIPALSLRLAWRWIRIAGSVSGTCIVHFIDARSNPRDRAGWCSPGSGIVPWEELMSGIRHAFDQVAVIFEYETVRDALNGRTWLSDWFIRRPDPAR